MYKNKNDAVTGYYAGCGVFSLENNNRKVKNGDKIMAETAIYGYIRVSSKDQNEERQRRAKEEYAISPRNMIVDRQSGKDFERPGYRRLMKK